ncbi:hypothetical protein GCM10010885_12670 [Alicyclobacillus cellulosilyticus]|uniref:Thioredoxin domain-containing protein n=1 Tax=Alicyclobacillus cellulosilyticus TaxID=1003997 RepID=A0A917K8J2_9BACL|nr:thioredoxin family protein [Alicyclobacillus cellulosilyticus]GGJ04998.1 hypothetical protein GCM10010885_12670 [Alicyclobacillus cellulosilyticus]
MLTDVTPAQLRSILAGNPDVWVYLHTPLCGTCQLARRMLQLALAALAASGREVTVYACDINGLAAEAAAWRITSVPCLARFRAGAPAARMYAFLSVPDVYTFLTAP